VGEALLLLLLLLRGHKGIPPYVLEIKHVDKQALGAYSAQKRARSLALTS
jgi:hypothetical protein